MEIKEYCCPITGERIIGWRVVNMLPKWGPFKNHVQFDLQLVTNDTVTLAMSQTGFNQCRRQPTLVQDVWYLTQVWWLDHGFPAAKKYRYIGIKTIAWETVMQGLRVR